MKKYYADNRTNKKFEINTQEVVNNQLEIISWGKKNDTPQELIKLLNTSPVHRGIIESKVSYIISDGWEVVSGQVEEFLKNGSSDYDLTDVSEQCVFDLENFGAFALKLVFNNIGEYAYCEQLDVDLLRKSVVENEWVYCEDWSNNKTEKRIYDVFTYAKDKGSYILYFKLPTKRLQKELGVYPKPSYVAALTDIEASAEICHFRVSSIKNNFSLGTIINNPNGIPETDEEKEAARDFADQFQNDGEYNGGYVINYSDGKDKEITVTQLNGNDLDKRYLQTEQSVINNILTGHSVTSPMLVGIKVSGQLGGSDELENAFNIFKQTYVSKRQNFVNRAFNYVLNVVAGIDGEIALKEAELKNNIQIESEVGVADELNKMSPLLATKVLDTLTINEIRALARLQGVEGGDEIPVPTADLGNQFSRKSRIIELFSKTGKKITDLNIVFAQSVPNDFTTSDADTFSSDIIKTMFDEVAGVTATDKRFTVLNLIKDGNRVQDIATITEQSIDDVYRNIKELKEAGYLSESLKITTKGVRALDIVEVPIDEFEVRYTYDKRDDIAGSTLIDTSRDFCREMIGLGRAYTRAEIDVISGIEGRDVFKDRGGWYHNPNTDRTTPFCRHIWKFILVKK